MYSISKAGGYMHRYRGNGLEPAGPQVLMDMAMHKVTHKELAWAREVFCLSEVSSYNEVKRVWKMLLKRAHPDKGGTNEKTRQINKARDILLSFTGDYPCRLDIDDADDWWQRRFGGIWDDKD